MNSFSLIMVFVPMDFSMTRFLTRHYVMKDGESRRNVEDKHAIK